MLSDMSNQDEPREDQSSFFPPNFATRKIELGFLTDSKEVTNLTEP